MEINWEISGAGRSWRSGEAMDRYFLVPEKIEMVDGKLFWSDEDREAMLCLLLENVGANRAVQFGDLAIWKTAIANLEK